MQRADDVSARADLEAALRALCGGVITTAAVAAGSWLKLEISQPALQQEPVALLTWAASWRCLSGGQLVFGSQVDEGTTAEKHAKMQVLPGHRILDVVLSPMLDVTLLCEDDFQISFFVRMVHPHDEKVDFHLVLQDRAYTLRTDGEVKVKVTAK